MNISLIEARERLHDEVAKFKRDLPEAQTLHEFKKQAVDRFDLAQGHDLSVRRHFDDYTEDSHILLEMVWESYRKDRHLHGEKYPEFLAQARDQTISDFREEVYS